MIRKKRNEKGKTTNFAYVHAIWLLLAIGVWNQANAQINTNKFFVGLQSDDITACSGGNSTFSIRSKANDAHAFQLTVDLSDGISYVSGSVTIVSQTGSSDFTVSEVDVSDPNQPIFGIERPNDDPWQVNDEVHIRISKTSNCDAVQFSYGGGLFKDVHTITFEDSSGTVSNSDTDLTVNSYNLFRPSLALSDIDPMTLHVGESDQRNVSITNSGNGNLTTFEHFVEVPTAFQSGYSLSFNGTALTPSSTSGTIFTYTIDLSQAPFLGNVGDGDALFENETIVLREEISMDNCTSTDLFIKHHSEWGCSSSDTCQTTNQPVGDIVLAQYWPSFELTTVNTPTPQMNSASTYTVELLNYASAENAYNVNFNVGFGWFSSLSSPWENPLYGPDYRNDRTVSNFRFTNGTAFTPTRWEKTDGTGYGLGSYLVGHDLFTSDPDGPGGLEDLDGDGFFDDMAPGATTQLNVDLSFSPLNPGCSEGSSQYIFFEQLQVHMWSTNLCGNLTQQHKEALNQTDVYAESLFNWGDPERFDPDIEDGAITHLSFIGNFRTGGVAPTCSGIELISNDASTTYTVSLTVPNGITLDASASSDYTQSGNTIQFQISNLEDYEIGGWEMKVPIDFPLNIDCNTYTGGSTLNVPFSINYNSSCFNRQLHCGDFELEAHCNTTCDGAVTSTFDANRVTAGWTDETMATKVTLDANTHDLKMYMPRDEMVINASAFMRNETADNLFFEIRYVTDNSGVDMSDIIQFESGTITINDLSSGSQSTAITVNPTVSTQGTNDNFMRFDLSSYRSIISGTYEYGEGNEADEISLELHFRFKDSFPETSRLYEFYSFEGTFYTEDGAGTPTVCETYNDRAFFFGAHVVPSVQADNYVTGCDEKWIKVWLGMYSGLDDKFPNEFRPLATWDEVTIEIPPGMHFNNKVRGEGWPNIMPANEIPDATNGGLNYSLSGNVITITKGPNFRYMDQGGNVAPSFGISVYATSQTPSLSHHDLSIEWDKFAYTDTPEAVTDNYNEPFNYHNVEYNFIANQTNVSGNSLLESFTIDICKQWNTAPTDFNWLRVETGGNFQITSAEEEWPNAGTIYNVVEANGVYYIEYGSLGWTDDRCRLIKFEGTYTSCSPIDVNVSQNYDCIAYPTDYSTTAFFHEQTFTLDPVDAVAQLAILSQPTSTVDMCDNYDIELEVRNAGGGDLIDPVLTFDIPGDITGLEIVNGTVDIEYPRNSGNTEQITPQISGNTVTINLSDHTQVGSQNGMFGTLNSASIDEQIAIVTMTMSPQCNFRSNTGTTYEITGKSPCGANATGSGSRLSSNPIILTGAEPPYSTNNITLNTPTINGCDNGSIEVETHIVDGVTGNSDFTRITLPAGLLYTTGSFASTGTVAATLQSTDIVNGKQEIEITLPSGVSNTDTISYEFDVESSADICAGTHEIDLSTFVTVTGLSCNGTACGEIEVVTGEAITSIDIEKGQLEEDDTFTHTATYFQSGGDTTYSLNFGIENTGTEDLGPNLEYNVYCADASGVATGSSLYTGTITSVIAAGGTFEENASFTTSNFCGDDANMVVEFEPGTANCFCTELLIGITSEETTDFGSVDFVDDDITVNEADGTATIEVVFTGNVPGGFTLDFASADNTTTVGSDYVGVNSSLTFSGTDGEIVPITIFILDDDLIESIENLFVNLSNPSSPLVTIVDDQATVNITGNETDEDNDNIANVVDLDNDNDGILDSNEAVACIDDDYFNWGFNSPSGTRSVDFVQNPAITDWMISNTDDIVVGAGLTGTSPGSELEITGLGETTYLGAIEEDDYIEMSFTTGTDLVDPIIERMGVNWFQNSNGRGHSYDAAIAISKDDFATSSLLNADVRINYPSNGVSEFFDLTASGITYKLEENTTYTVRFYAYNQQTDGTLPHSVFDDFTIRVSSCQAQDSDNDTVPDHLDEDSDDDGCVDAIEAGHTDPDDDGELGNATVTVDSNGQVTGQGGYTGTNTHVTTPFVAVTFDSQPTDEVSNTGDTVSFTANVSGGATLSYQWQESTDSGTSWSDITDGGIYSGATTNTLTLTGVSGTQHNNDYRLVVTSSDNNCSTYNSASANLFVNTTEICNDGADNDGDGLVDCDDPDCYLAANSGDIDTDGDGIGDSCDLDRDNDGILNEEECAVNVTLHMAGNPTTLNGNPLTAQESVSPGDVIEITNAGVLADGTNLVVRIVIEDIVTGPAFDPSGGETGAFYDPTSGSIAIEQFDPTNDSHVKFYIEVLDSNTNTPLTIYGEGIFKDIDSQAGRDFTEVLGIGHGLSATLGQNLSAVTYVNGNGPGTDQTYFGQNPANAGDPNNWTDEENNNANTVENWATVSYRFVNRLHLSYGVTGSQLGFNPNGNRALSLTDFTIREYCDTDNDGRPDVIDLDSDDDGCVDAIEAGHTDPDDDGELGNAPITADNSGRVTGQGGYTGTNTHVTTPFVAVTFDSQPTDEVSNTGDTVSFTATVSGGATVSYQWQESSDSGTSWSDITDGGIYSGATTNTLTLTGVSGAQHNNDYRLAVTSSDNNCSTYNSASANLFVNTTEICNDGVDNDGDGLVDCDDPDCYLAANSGDTDTDGDGIGDLCDLDSDNDGILNSQECTTNVILELSNNPTTINGTLITSKTAIAVNDVIRVTNVGVLQDGTDLVAQIVIENMTAGAEYNPVTGGIQLGPFDSTVDDYIEFYVEVLNADTGLPLLFQGESLFKDTDSQDGRDFTEIFGIGPGLSASLGTSLIETNYTNGGGPGDDQTYYGVNPALVGNPLNWIDEENTPNEEPNHWITVSYSFINRLNLSFGVTGNENGYGTSRGLILSDIGVRDFCDSDNDNIPNIIDLDSDNDGCFDTVEAGHADPDDDGELGNAPITVDTSGRVTGQGGYTGTNPDVVTPRIVVNYTTHPVDTDANIGDTVTLSASVAFETGGLPEPTDVYTWQISTDAGATWSDLSNGGIYSGVNTLELTITNVPIESNNNQFRLQVSNPTDKCIPTTNSNVATLFLDQADLSIDKNISDTTPNTGDTVTFTIDIVNNGPDSATNVSLEDIVPQGYTINTGSISNGGTLVGNTISWDIANVPAGTLQLSYTATVNAPTGTAGEYRNVVQVTASDQFDPDSTPNNDDGDQSEDDEDSTQDVGVNAANLSVEKGIIGTAPNVGDTVTFYIRLLNDGPNEATGIIIEDLLPSGYTLDQTSISHGGNYASNVITWNIASLLAGELVLTYDAVVNPPVGTAGEYTNVAQVTASDQFDPNSTPDNYDPNMPNEDDEAEYTLPSMEADINIVKTVSPTMARLGDTVTFTVSVENQGAITATNITVEDSLPNGYSLNSLDTSHGTFDPTLDSWDIPALTAGEIATLTMEVTVVEGTDYTNVATLVAMDQLDPNPSNDMSEAEVTIEEEDCLLVFNEFSPNGDGANEVFFIQCIDHYPNNHLKIFNRWGNLVYEKHGYNNDWDGTSYGRATMRAEEKLPVGTYYYILDLGESGSDLESKTGWLYITR